MLHHVAYLKPASSAIVRNVTLINKEREEDRILIDETTLTTATKVN
jgi:hypothetical protein